MSKTKTAPYRSFHVAWSDADRQHVGLCEQFPSLSHLADSEGEALAGIMRLVEGGGALAGGLAYMGCRAEATPNGETVT